MSRWYWNETFIRLGRDATDRDLEVAIAAYRKEWALKECSAIDGQVYLWGQSKLVDGEKEAHTRIVRRMRQAFPGCRVTTMWTCLEDLPCEEYVSEPEKEPRAAPQRRRRR